MMAIEDYDFVPLRVDTEIKPFKSRDNDLNGFLFDDAQKYLTDLMWISQDLIWQLRIKRVDL